MPQSGNETISSEHTELVSTTQKAGDQFNKNSNITTKVSDNTNLNEKKLENVHSYSSTGNSVPQFDIEQLETDIGQTETRLINTDSTTEIIEIEEEEEKENSKIKAQALLDEANINHYQLAMTLFHSSFDEHSNDMEIKKQDLLDLKEKVISVDSENNDYKNKILNNIDKSITVLEHKRTNSFQIEQTNEVSSQNTASNLLHTTNIEASKILITDSLSNPVINLDIVRHDNLEDDTDSATDGINSNNSLKISKIVRKKSDRSLTKRIQPGIEYSRKLPKTVLSNTEKINNSYSRPSSS